MSINITQLQQANTLSKVVIFANDTTSGIFLGGFIVAIFFVMLLVLKKWEFIDALLSASFSCFILSAVIAYGGLISIIYPLAFLAIMAFSAFYSYVTKRD